jgi:hypothetical protein
MSYIPLPVNDVDFDLFFANCADSELDDGGGG